jgi:hypothetical protein
MAMFVMKIACNHFLLLDGKDSFAKKVVYGRNVDPKSGVSAEDYEKREDLDEIWPKISLIFC